MKGAFTFLGSSTGLTSGNPSTTHARLKPGLADARFGASINPVGDLDSDGYDDFIIGSYQYETGQLHEGAASVFAGGPTGITDGGPTTADRRFDGNAASARFGASAAGAGDIDGHPDLLIGAYRYSSPELNEGVAFLFAGPILAPPVPGLGATGIGITLVALLAFGWRAVRPRAHRRS
jgi:hypothetical protein